MNETWPAALRAVIGEDRWAPERLAGLTPAERALYGSILRGFVDGRVPDPAAQEELRELVQRDLVALDGDSAVAAAYPFSARPTRHRVHTEDGRRYWAMCAIDAFGVAFLLTQAAEIQAREPRTGRPVTVVVDPAADTIAADPPGAFVAAARAGTGCTAACACPHINLFGSRGAAERYLAEPGLRGALLSVADTAAAGRALFGGLRDVVTRSAFA